MPPTTPKSQRCSAHTQVASSCSHWRNIGGSFVLDIDEKNNISGRDSLKDLEKEFGKLPDTWKSSHLPAADTCT